MGLLDAREGNGRLGMRPICRTIQVMNSAAMSLPQREGDGDAATWVGGYLVLGDCEEENAHTLPCGCVTRRLVSRRLEWILRNLSSTW